jgi:hypothetical protein
VDAEANHSMIQGQHLALRCHPQKRSMPTGLLARVQPSSLDHSRDDGNDKLSLITESVAVTRINIHPVGEEPD